MVFRAILLSACLAVLFVKTSPSGLSLGTCTLHCSENERVAGQTLGVAPQGPPGKRGVIGPRGIPGSKGERGNAGPRGEACDCSQHAELAERVRMLEASVATLNRHTFARDCIDLRQSVSDSGTAIIFPIQETSMGIHVFCNQDIDGGGWIVIQRRMDGSEDFFRGWNDYVNGFGDKEREFWLGLEAIHQITSHGTYELRFDLEAFDGAKAFAKYSNFALADSSDFYRLTVSGYSGSAGDAMAHHNGNPFSTKEGDRDQSPTEHCAVKYTGAWWYNYCHHTNPNGVYNGAGPKGVTWAEMKNKHESLKKVEMKIRRRA